MPGHDPSKRPTRSKLTKAQQQQLATHGKTYTPIHIANMRRRMTNGMSFSKAHSEVMKMKIKHKR
tara:strand:- start:1915 stop:2109 length:195 start_codon:yes stop_codon:yes gene_type:complete